MRYSFRISFPILKNWQNGIDKIYEANVLAGKIKDTAGGFERFLEKLKAVFHNE